MKRLWWGSAAVGCLVLAWAAYVNPAAAVLVLGSGVLLGASYLYFVYFGRPSQAATLEQVRDNKWHTVDLGPKTRSSDASPYALFFRRGHSKNLLIQFSGGGACWDGHTAHNPITLRSVIFGYTRELKGFYFKTVTRLFPAALGGIADNRDPKNAFRDWNVVFIPYSTGDMHVGNTSNTYVHRGKALEVHHKGRNNCRASLDWVYANFRAAEKIMVSGESSGAWASAFYAPFIAERYPTAKIYCLSDGVGVVSRRWRDIFDNVWKADSSQSLGFEIATDPFEDSLLRRTDSRNQRIKYLHSNTLYDDTLTRFSAALNQLPIETTQFIDQWAANTKASTRRLSKSKLIYHYFLTDWGHDARRHTTQHTLTTNEYYHKCSAEGVSFADWLRRNVVEDEGLSLGKSLLD
jgi:hypothetical protein